MRRFARLGLLLLPLVPALSALRGHSQELPPPAPPPPLASDASDCVARFGHTGCAARLYAQLLCHVVGQPQPIAPLQQVLERQYVEAGIDFRGVTVSQVEAAAVRYYAPMLCPEKSDQIRELFARPQSPAPG